jgi:hypothetical protein
MTRNTIHQPDVSEGTLVVQTGDTISEGLVDDE